MVEKERKFKANQEYLEEVKKQVSSKVECNEIYG
jgi:hypothetical protein